MGDVLSSSVVFASIIVAVRRADADFPYGHGRVETVAALVVRLILTAPGAGIC